LPREIEDGLARLTLGDCKTDFNLIPCTTNRS
jgi:hypothetical protein